jgi:hypothetical protein
MSRRGRRPCKSGRTVLVRQRIHSRDARTPCSLPHLNWLRAFAALSIVVYPVGEVILPADGRSRDSSPCGAAAAWTVNPQRGLSGGLVSRQISYGFNAWHMPVILEEKSWNNCSCDSCCASWDDCRSPAPWHLLAGQGRVGQQIARTYLPSCRCAPSANSVCSGKLTERIT